MIQSTQGLFGVLAGTGLGLAATKFVAEYRATDPARAARCIALATLIAAIGGLVGSAVLMVFANELASSLLQAPHLSLELQVATGLLFFGAINGVQTGALAGIGDFRAVALVNILRGACLFVALLIGITAGGVLGGVIGLVVTEALAVIASQIALQRLCPPRWDRLVWSELAEVVRFSGLAVLASLATTAAMWYGNVVLATQSDGYAALGIFNAADRWRQLLLFLPAALAPNVLSMLSNLHGNRDSAGFRKLIGLNLWLSVLVVVLPTGALMFLAPMAMSIFGAEYEVGATTLVILAVSAIAVVLNTLLGQILVSQGAIWWRFVLDLFLAAALAVSCWWAVPVWNAEGLAVGHLIAFSATALALVVPVVAYWNRLRVVENGAP